MENRQKKYSYETLSAAVNDLIKRGYTADFLVMMENDCLICNEHSLSLSPEEFTIDELYRFEGMSDPSDESIVYAISSEKHNVKGIVINSYGADYGFRSSKLVEHLNKNI